MILERGTDLLGLTVRTAGTGDGAIEEPHNYLICARYLTDPATQLGEGRAQRRHDEVGGHHCGDDDNACQYVSHGSNYWSVNIPPEVAELTH
jgi:hypothetical protein